VLADLAVQLVCVLRTAEAVLNVAPFAPIAGKVAGRMIKATEGMPVGMGIKDVGKNIFEDATKYHQKVPEIKSINVAKLKTHECWRGCGCI
jgi:uncharacterized protein (DUF697 family)